MSICTNFKRALVFLNLRDLIVVPSNKSYDIRVKGTDLSGIIKATELSSEDVIKFAKDFGFVSVKNM